MSRKAMAHGQLGRCCPRNLAPRLESRLLLLPPPLSNLGEMDRLPASSVPCYCAPRPVCAVDSDVSRCPEIVCHTTLSPELATFARCPLALSTKGARCDDVPMKEAACRRSRALMRARSSVVSRLCRCNCTVGRSCGRSFQGVSDCVSYLKFVAYYSIA